MVHPSWNESYAAGELPWDTGEPEPLLVEFVTSGRVQPTQTLEIGAGTGTNAVWLAERGFEVLGIDVAPLAVERAIAKSKDHELACHCRRSEQVLDPTDRCAATVTGHSGAKSRRHVDESRLIVD